jgi:hypothetical protein
MPSIRPITQRDTRPTFYPSPHLLLNFTLPISIDLPDPFLVYVGLR